MSPRASSAPSGCRSSLLSGEFAFLTADWSAGAVLAVLLSCAVGVAISYAGFNLRNLISATSFTVTGVVCKILTVLINDVIWTQHSNAVGHLSLLTCIGGGYLSRRDSPAFQIFDRFDDET